MEVHSTVAVIGMPYASHAIRLWPTLVSLSVLTIIGATFAGQDVQQAVRLDIVNPAGVTAWMLVVIEFGALLLTTVYTCYKVPTSTFQIVVFCPVGTALARGTPVISG